MDENKGKIIDNIQNDKISQLERNQQRMFLIQQQQHKWIKRINVILHILWISLIIFGISLAYISHVLGS